MKQRQSWPGLRRGCDSFLTTGAFACITQMVMPSSCALATDFALDVCQTRRMSAFGGKRTSRGPVAMSAIDPKRTLPPFKGLTSADKMRLLSLGEAMRRRDFVKARSIQ